MKQTGILATTLFAFVHMSQCTIVVQGNDTTAPKAFKTAITTKAYDKRTGTFFVGLASGTDRYAISKAARPSFVTTPFFSPVLSSSSNLTTATIEFLVCSPQPTLPAALVIVSQGTLPQSANTFIGLLSNGTETPETSALNDAGGTATSDGIVQVEASSTHAFAFVKPAAAAPFGDAGTGIALIGINATATTISLDIKDAPAGINGNKATELQKASTVLKGTGGGNDVTVTDSQTTLFWDEPLQRLFIGLHIQTGAAITDIGKAVVVARLDNGALTLQEITPDAAITGAGTDEIIVAQDSTVDLKPNHLRVMHTSTGPDYLIADCTITAGTGHRVFALPLVNNTSSPTAASNGTLAKKDSALNTTTKKFTVAASTFGDLPINNTITDPEAVVGAGDLPIAASSAVSDIVILGDAVYLSFETAPDATNETGIWSSQALFDDTGKIIRWTPWTKRTVPLNAFSGITLPGGSTHNGSIKFFDIDGATGNIWLVEGSTEQTVGITSWSTGISSNDLISKLTTSLTSGSYSVLDLDQATRGFLSTTAHRYALFGGGNRVVFARISQSFDPANLVSPQTVITDYSSVQNFLVTSLPDNSGCCHVLEYSRTSTTADNDATRTTFGYFFAGTQNGLYVFADSNGNGFNAISLSTLNLTPFSGGSWQKVTTLSGPIVDIKTSGAGRTLYVIMMTPTTTNPLRTTLYSVPFAATIAAMFAPTNIFTIARAGDGVLRSTLQFFGIQIIATDDPRAVGPENKEQLVLATNQGLFRSNASQAGSASVATVTTQVDANWQLIQDGNKTTALTAFYAIAGANTPIRHTTWPVSIQDQHGFKTYDRGSVHQISGIGEPAGTDALFNSFFIPEHFNAQTTSTSFATLHPIIHFFSDGGRRFFVFNRITDPADQTKLGTLPFDINSWNIAQLDIINHPTLSAVDRIFWASQIGASGILMVGTEKGVIGLQ